MSDSGSTTSSVAIIEVADATLQDSRARPGSPDSLNSDIKLKRLSLDEAPVAPPSPSLAPTQQSRVTYGPLIIKPWPGCPPCVEGGPRLPPQAHHTAISFALGIASPNSSTAAAGGAALGASLAPTKRVAVFNTGGCV